ncbi:MAG: adenine deaminase C-terminal domain-containing protein [Haloarculaceae archaeon]
MNQLQPVALGEAPADLVVRGGDVFLAEAGTFARRDVAIVDDRIAALPGDAGDVVGDETTVVDASDRTVVPGFVDAHTHLDAGIPFERVHHLALQGGTTSIVSETNAFGTIHGAPGVEAFLDATADLPVNVVATVPPQPLYDLFEPKQVDDEEAAALVSLLDRERVAGVGEVTWIYVVGRDSPARSLIDGATDRGLPVTGHGAGCSGAKLAAYATVVDDDHEPIAAEEIVERVENGLHVVGRFGSRDDISALAEAYDALDDPDFSLSSDNIGLDRLAAGQYMNRVVERVIEEGVPPADAFRMATHRPARHFGLADRGSLAPGNVADVVVLSDRESVTVETVLAGGEVVVRDGDSLVGPRPHDYPDFFHGSLDASVPRGTFRVPADAVPGDAVRAIEHRMAMVTAETTVEPPVVDGAFEADPEADLAKVAAVDRQDGTCEFVGFVTGFGLRAGAVATTSAMQLPAVTVVGVDDDDMHAALDRVADLGGGWAVVRDGEVLADQPATLAGSCTDRPLPEVLDLDAGVREALQSLGAERSDVRVGISSIVFTGVPALKLSFSGYADVLSREVVGLSP